MKRLPLQRTLTCAAALALFCGLLRILLSPPQSDADAPRSSIENGSAVTSLREPATLLPIPSDQARLDRHPLLGSFEERNQYAPWRSAGMVLRGRVENCVGEGIPDVFVSLQLDPPMRGLAHIVEQLQQAHQGFATTRTDSDGYFLFEELPADQLLLRATSPQGEQAVLDQVLAYAKERADAAAVVLRFCPGIDLTLIYRDAAGQPLPNRHLALIHNKVEPALALDDFALTTNLDGQATMRGLVPGRYTIVGFANEQSIQVLRENIELTAHATLELESLETGQIEIHVEDSFGKPVPNAQFFALIKSSATGGAIHGTSDGSGIIRIDAVPVGQLLLFSVVAPAYSAWTMSDLENGASLAIEAQKLTRHRVTLKPWRSVAGLLIEELSERPLGQVDLVFRDGADPRGGICARARSDADGRFVLHGLPTGKIHVEARLPGWTPMQPRLAPLNIFASDFRERKAWDWIQIEAGDGVQSIKLAVPPRAAVEGVVRDSSDVVRSDVAVILEGKRNGFASRVRVRTDAQGKFRVLGLHAPCTWKISLESSASMVFCEEIELQAGEERSNLVLYLPNGQQLRGRVTCAGQAVAGAVIDLNPIGSSALQTRSDANGDFRLDGPHDFFKVRVRAARCMSWQGEVSSKDGELPFLNVELDAAVELQGVIQDESGQAIPNAKLTWRPLDPRASKGNRSEHGSSEKSGQFRFVVPARAGHIRVDADGFQVHQLELTNPLTAGVLQLTLVRGLDLAGRVLAADGSAAQHATIFLIEGESRSVRTADAAGQFAFRGLAPGTYSIEALPSSRRGIVEDRPSTPLQVVAGQTDIVLRLEPGQKITGRVDTTALEQGIGTKLSLEAHDRSQQMIGAAAVGSDGSFAMGGLAPDIEVWLRLGSQNGTVREQVFGPFRSDQRDIYLRAASGAVLRGRVVDRSGNPLVGMCVRIFEEEHLTEQPVTPARQVATDREGLFRVAGLSTGSLRLELWNPASPTRKKEVPHLRAGDPLVEISFDN